MTVGHRWTREFEQTRCRERAWGATTIGLGVAALLVTVYWIAYSYLLVSGVRQSLLHLEHSDALLRYTRLAWMGKHGCAGNEQAIINVHCPTVEKWIADKIELEPMALASNQSYHEVFASVLLLRNESYAAEYFAMTIPSAETWIGAHMWMGWVASKVVMPAASFACIAVSFVALWVLPWASLRTLRTTALKRRELVKQSVRSFSTSLSEPAESNDEGFPNILNETGYGVEGSSNSTASYQQFSSSSSWFDTPAQPLGVRQRRADAAMQQL